jgi:hypothetical protein
VPIDSVGRAGGTEHAVRQHDLLERIGAEDRGDLDAGTLAPSAWAPRGHGRRSG